MFSELRRVVPEAEFRPYFADEENLRAAALAPFNRYLSVETPDRASAAIVVSRLETLDLVEAAYVEGGPVPPPVNPADDGRSKDQGYLSAAPAGIDARWTWSLTDGAGIRFVDLERGWTLDHEDLAAAKITLISGVSTDYHGHGTAVLGEVLAVDNAVGDVGIAPGAAGRVVSQWRDPASYNSAAAILSAAQAMSAGDVLLLEAQTRIGDWENMPVEVETAVFDAIRHAADAGIIVIEAGGNGGHDLDTFQDSANRNVLNRQSPDFRDSGAIMVGAASSTVPHSRLNFSNHGSRIDCYGWGNNIDTTGDGWQGTSTTEYTPKFSGTSGASPIVAGAAVLLQSWRKSQDGQVFHPQGLRNMMSSPTLNTASANPPGDRIGVMPDLRAILIDQSLRVKNEKYVSLVYILFGLIDNSPGKVWIPGRGPVPVDPGWLALVRGITAPQRDLLAALAVNEIAQIIEDPDARAKMANAATDAMHAAVDRIARIR
ncbi:S8 family peptidase [Pseudarthrobacter sp. H2]|uniref:S8 family peptidase n=1 Tax=Pseudarthrobacter sp. H2 TaxID=3418415 RepID=UPI003CF8F2A1